MATQLARYQWAAKYCKNKNVGDIACGEGYGCELLKKNGASMVIGMDLSEVLIKEWSVYQENNENLFFIVGDGLSIPFRNSQLDVITSMETIEHVNIMDPIIRTLC